MKKYLKQHIVVIITLVISIVASIFINFYNEVSWIDNLIIALLILLITTFIFDFNKILDKILDKINNFGQRLNPSSVKDFDSVDKCANEVFNLIKSGKHTVDFVSLDSKIRTQMKTKRRPMVKLLNKFVSSDKIKLRYITTINSGNYKTILKFIIASKSGQKESFYAICDSTVPFASFYIIDKRYLIIRTPYNSTVEKHYCIIDDKAICALFVSWFEMLWQSSNIIDTPDELRNIFNTVKNDMDASEMLNIENLTNQACSFFE